MTRSGPETKPPLIRVAGSVREQGREHGRLLCASIEKNLAVYRHRFIHEVRLSVDEVIRRAVLYLEAIRRHSPAYVEGMEGISEGSGIELEWIAALNVRYEILYHQFATMGNAADGCTAVAIPPVRSLDGHLMLAQNWDWIPEIEGAIVHASNPEGGLETLSFTEAGILGGKIGMNSRGIGLAINGLLSTGDRWSRLAPPFHVRCYDILLSETFEDAVRVATALPRSCSANFLLAAVPDHTADIETAPETHRRIDPEGGAWTAHTNHFLDPAALGIKEPPDPRHAALSCRRLERIAVWLSQKERLGLADLGAALRDHEGYPGSICRHFDPVDLPEERYATVVSIIMDLTDRRMLVRAGPPCENEGFEASLAGWTG